MKAILTSAVCVAALCAAPSQASTILGIGPGALIGGDLTDPENDGAPDADTNYNATFASSNEPGFGGGEFAFNVFDNQVGGGNAKWCCGVLPVDSQWVQATFDQPVIIEQFTLTSGNDTPGRDPVTWAIQGSNDGVSFVDIHSHTGSNVWTDRDQVIEWSVSGGDFTTPEAYTTIRFTTSETGLTGGAFFQLNEVELFGTVIPEPSALTLLAFAGLGLISRRRR